MKIKLLSTLALLSLFSVSSCLYNPSDTVSQQPSADPTTPELSTPDQNVSTPVDSSSNEVTSTPADSSSNEVSSTPSDSSSVEDSSSSDNPVIVSGDLWSFQSFC